MRETWVYCVSWENGAGVIGGAEDLERWENWWNIALEKPQKTERNPGTEAGLASTRGKGRKVQASQKSNASHQYCLPGSFLCLLLSSLSRACSRLALSCLLLAPLVWQHACILFSDPFYQLLSCVPCFDYGALKIQWEILSPPTWALQSFCWLGRFWKEQLVGMFNGWT